MSDEPTPTTEPLRLTQAARALELPTRDVTRLVHEHKIRYVVIDGIAHIPADAIDEYRAAVAG